MLNEGQGMPATNSRFAKAGVRASMKVKC